MKITIELDCNEKTCGKCKHQIKQKGAVCSIFIQFLPVNKKGQFLRLPECINACKVQEKL